MDPMDTHWRMLMVRERELQVAFAEYSFLSMCGGVYPQDVIRMRANITGVLPPPVVVVKIEDEEVLPTVVASEIVPLKQMIKDLLTGDNSDIGETQFNSLCRSVRMACGESLRTFKRHHSAFVRVEDADIVRAALERVLKTKLNGGV